MRIHNEFISVSLHYVQIPLKRKKTIPQIAQPAPASQLQTSYIIRDLWGHQNTDVNSNATPVQAWAPGSRYATVRQIYR